MKLFDGIPGSECDGESQVIANGFANHENDDPHNEKNPVRLFFCSLHTKHRLGLKIAWLLVFVELTT